MQLDVFSGHISTNNTVNIISWFRNIDQVIITAAYYKGRNHKQDPGLYMFNSENKSTVSHHHCPFPFSNKTDLSMHVTVYKHVY